MRRKYQGYAFALILAATSSSALAQGGPNGGGSGASLATQIEALTARVTALESRATGVETRVTGTETINTSQATAIAALSGRVTVTETDITDLSSELTGPLTASDLAGEYAIVGLQTRLYALSALTGMRGINVTGATSSGHATIAVREGQPSVAVISRLELCAVGKRAYLRVENASQTGGEGAAKPYPAGPNDANFAANPNNPCIGFDHSDTLADAPTIDLSTIDSNSTVSFEIDDDVTSFYTADRGRIWVLDNLNRGLIEQDGFPEDAAAEFIMLVKTTP